MPPGFAEWQDEEGRKLLDAAVTTVREAASDAGAEVEVSTDMVAGPAIPVGRVPARSTEPRGFRQGPRAGAGPEPASAGSRYP